MPKHIEVDENGELWVRDLNGRRPATPSLPNNVTQETDEKILQVVGWAVCELAHLEYVPQGMTKSAVAHAAFVRGIKLTEEEKERALAEAKRQLSIIFEINPKWDVDNAEEGNPPPLA